MSNTVIQLKFSAVPGNTPSSLANGEIAINTYDGKFFYRGGASNTIQSITRYTGPAGLDTELQFNDAGSLGGSEKLTFNKTTGLLTVNGTVRANIFSDDGVDIFDFANNAYNTANSKSQVYQQNNAPSIAGATDFWIANTGVMYQNFGNSANPVWAEVGPTGTLANTSPGIVNASQVQIGGKQAVNGPAFRAYIDTSQTIPGNGVQTKTTFGSETFDTNSNFASSRFTPTVEGYYQLNATVRISGNSGTGECMITIWKNGSEYSRGTNESGTEQGSSFYSMQVSDIAYANGTGDYFEIYIQQASGGNRDTTAGTNISYFSGLMVRGA